MAKMWVLPKRAKGEEGIKGGEVWFGCVCEREQKKWAAGDMKVSYQVGSVVEQPIAVRE
jgi:hypothetical protein